MIKNAITYSLLLLGTLLNAQISFKAVVDKPEVRVGERFQVSFIITSADNVKISATSLPNFENFQVLGRNSGSNISYKNGELTKQYVESIVLLAQKAGEFSLAPARIKVDGKEVLSNTLKILVQKQDKNVPDNTPTHNHLQMALQLSKNEAYPNENILMDVKIYAKSYDLLRRRSDIEVPGISGFQVVKISQNQERNFQQEVVNGEVYVSEEIAQFQLKPTQTGDLEIPPFKIRLAIPIDIFEERIVLLKTKPQTIHVKDLPANAPKSFTGAVGNFKLNTIVDKSDTKVNKPIDYEVELIGEGNLSNVELPKLSLPTELELYPAKRRNAFKKTLEGEKGKVVDRYVIVPQYSGNYTIPSMNFSYFDPEKEKYETLRTEEQNITVTGRAKPEIDDQGLDDIKAQEKDSTTTDIVSKNVQNLNNQVKEIIQIPDMAVLDEDEDSRKMWLWLLLIPFVGVVIFYLIRKKRKRPTEEEAKHQKDLKHYREQLKLSLNNKLEALETSKNHKNVTDFTSNAAILLNQIVSLFDNVCQDKIYTQAEASEILSNHLAERVLAQWEMLHQKNQLMRYAGNSSDEDLHLLYHEYQALVKDSLNKAS